MKARWQRKRQPDEVPTPVAVALSDYCRRAKSPAPAPEVRAALAMLSEDEDFRLEALAEGEPEASPLGPWAVIDVLSGTAPQVAAQRQEVGYYELASELAELGAQPAPVQSAPAPAEAPATEPVFAAAPKPGRAAKAAEPSVSERIAPKKRAATSEPAPPDSAPAPFHKRELPKPRGRFAQLSAKKLPSEELFGQGGQAVLEAALAQHPHRFSLQRALAEQYQSRGGSELSLADLESALRKHELVDVLDKKERELLLGSYTEHRGAAGRVAWALGVHPGELNRLIALTGLTAEVEELRERFRREALSPKNLTSRLDLLGRTRYLADLGIAPKFRDALARDLRGILEPLAPRCASLNELCEQGARAQGTEGELLLRAVEKLGLSEDLKRRLSRPAANDT